MKYSEAKPGRVFTIRLDQHDTLPQSLENFAQAQCIARAICYFIGGVQDPSKLVVGPRHTDRLPVVPMHLTLSGAHEVLGIGTLFPDKHGKPVLHAHAAFGRKNKTKTGCIRLGITSWRVIEVVLMELLSDKGFRMADPVTGLEMLEPDAEQGL